MGRARNSIRWQTCVADKTQMSEIVITSLVYAPGARPTCIIKHCAKEHSQACFHYSSAIRVNPGWSTITCHPEATTTAHRLERVATDTYSTQHDGKGWQDASKRMRPYCDRDEYPPAYLLHENDPAYFRGGKDSTAQLVADCDDALWDNAW